MVNDNTEILIRADDKLPNNITLKKCFDFNYVDYKRQYKFY